LQLARGPEGWGLLDQPDQVEALMGSCEVRGVREKELKANLDKVRKRGRGRGRGCCWWWWSPEGVWLEGGLVGTAATGVFRRLQLT
jgi:hypothetical protein